jgi:peptidoglycan-N-acetylglucosamine deacetylase
VVGTDDGLDGQVSRVAGIGITIRRSAVVLTASTLLLTTVFTGTLVRPPSTALAAGNAAFQMERLAGADRYATAVSISKRFFPSAPVPEVFVAAGENWPDALAAGPAVARAGAPMLFVRRGAVPSVTRVELLRLRPQRVWVIGGTGVISEEVRLELNGLATGGAQRVAGGDRYATAGAIANRFFPSTPVVYVSTGHNFPDALAGGAAAAVQSGLILLVAPDAIPASTRSELQRLAPPKIVIVGGPSVVSSGVEAALRSYSASVSRLAGADRYQTAIAVSKAVFPAGSGVVFVATGVNFPDALAGVPAAGKQKGPILLVPGTALPASVASELSRLNPDRVFILGGSASVADEVMRQTQRRLGICWTSTKVGAGSQQLFTRIPNAPNQVALTFDMGGRLVPALSILDFLIKNQVCATIFPTGAISQTPEGQKVLSVIRANPHLFEVGNHTMHHCDLANGGGGAACPSSAPSSSFIGKELTDANAVIRAATGQNTAPYWRPPYGAHDSRVRNAAAAAGYTKTFMWDVDTIDWRHPNDGGPTATQISNKVVSNSVSGSVVLMHLGGWNTRDALPPMISGLRNRGFTLTTLSDMLN